MCLHDSCFKLPWSSACTAVAAADGGAADAVVVVGAAGMLLLLLLACRTVSASDKLSYAKDSFYY